jgi:EAL domain-containing protein (putative c-di-GMP-specific phosphodiesterase class I)
MTAEPLVEVLIRPGSLHAVFQPVFALGGDRGVRFVEGLTRGPRGTNVEAAGVLFEYARRKCIAVELDRICVRGILEALGRPPAAIGVSLNVHAATLEHDRGFPDLLLRLAEANQIDAAQLIVEIVEHAPAHSGNGFLAALANLRAHGISIALDDIGSGQSSYSLLLDTNPEYFKIDRHLVQGCHTDLRRQAVLDSIRGLARTFSAQVVAEGIETPEDLETVRRLGFDMAQGFLLAEPQPAAALPRHLRETS